MQHLKLMVLQVMQQLLVIRQEQEVITPLHLDTVQMHINRKVLLLVQIHLLMERLLLQLV